MAWTAGFDRDEAQQLIAMLVPLEGATPPPLQAPPFPPGWTIVFESPEIGIFDNKWQLVSNAAVPGRYAVLIRGTVDEKGSVIDDLLSLMIPAAATVFGLPYRFAADPRATVHLGFALAALLLLFEPDNGILATLIKHRESISDILIAGHSQGAAIAALCHSFFAYLPLEQIRAIGYKTYMFAQPKPGNDHYANDFDRIAGSQGFGLRVTNSQDWVPQVPLTFQVLDDLNTPNPLSVLLTEHLILAPIEAALKGLKAGINLAQLAKHKPQMTRLAAAIGKQSWLERVAEHSEIDFPAVELKFDFVGCGLPIVLQGLPGGNPCDPKDSFWQHHASMYYYLLAGVPVPTACPG